MGNSKHHHNRAIPTEFENIGLIVEKSIANIDMNFEPPQPLPTGKAFYEKESLVFGFAYYSVKRKPCTSFSIGNKNTSSRSVNEGPLGESSIKD